MSDLNKVFPLCFLALTLSACNSDGNSSKGNVAVDSVGVKQLFLGGGHLVACSSMGQSNCNDWATYRQTILSDIAEEEIRVPVDEPVSVSDAYITRVLGTSPWQEEPQWQTALQKVLEQLQIVEADGRFDSWVKFKDAFIDVNSSTVGVNIDGTEVDGDYLWFNSSSEQWDALHYLKMDDGVVDYKSTAAKKAQIQAEFASNGSLLNKINDLTDQPYSYIDFVNALSPEFNALTIEQQFLLLRIFRNNISYDRPIEYVAFNDTSDQNSINAYRKFVDMAASLTAEGSQPRILVMTSSSNNNYDVADFYTSLFKQAGADAVWFPVDRAYRQAVDDGDCSKLQLYHDVYAGKPHQDIYFADYAAIKQHACEDPQSVLNMIESAHGLYINGGSQSRSLDSLITASVDSEEMSLIREKFENGELVIGGSSAGTAVQAGGRLNENAPINPMIDGGSSYDVLVSGYPSSAYNAEGGLGVFKWGITDTHFSERARETRLISLAQQQGVRLGFGVDEGTALIVNQPINTDNSQVNMSVVGAGGVYIIDLAEAWGDAPSPLWLWDVKSHYINEGDTFTFDPETEKYRINFSLSSIEVAVDAEAILPTEDDILWSKADNYRQLAKSMIKDGAASALGTSYESDPVVYEVLLNRQNDTLGVINKDGKVSYSAVYVSLSTQSQ